MITPQRLSLLQTDYTSRAYELGRDCALNGANEENCCFAIFATHESMKEWERGKRDGEKAKEQP